MTEMAHYPCSGCGGVTQHSHLHDTAHGIAETHMAGSERFVCHACGHVTLAGSHDADSFPFFLDVPPTRGTKVTR